MRRSLPALALVLVACGSIAEPPNSCFVAGTMVRTPAGAVDITTLRVGDRVLAFREADGAIVPRTVIAVFGGEVSRVRVFELEDGTTIETTDEHPFWDAERRRWLPAREVDRTTVLVRLDGDGRATRPTRVVATRDEPRRPTRVYNLTVDGEHTFFANDVATHNKSRPCDKDLCGNTANTIDIENRTDSPIDIDARNANSGAQISRDVFAGRVRLPPTGSPFLTSSLTSIAPGAHGFVTSDIVVAPNTRAGAGASASAGELIGAVIAVDGAAPVLVAGAGAIVVTKENGVPVIRAKDPRAVVVTPLAENVAACGADTHATGFDFERSAWDADAGTVSFGEVRPASDGCLTLMLNLVGGGTYTSIRACLDEDALPFALGDELRFTVRAEGATNGIHLERDDGATLDLLRTEILLGGSANVDGFTVTPAAGDPCERRTNACEDLEVPVTPRISGDPGDGSRLVTLGGRACHASTCGKTSCDGHAYVDVARIHAATRAISDAGSDG